MRTVKTRHGEATFIMMIHDELTGEREVILELIE
jgi:hypothetical protein